MSCSLALQVSHSKKKSSNCADNYPHDYRYVPVTRYNLNVPVIFLQMKVNCQNVVRQCRETENPNFESETRNPKSEIRNPKSEIRNPKSEIRNPKSEIRNPKSEIRNPKSEIRNPKSEIRNPKDPTFFGFAISEDS